MTDRRRINEGYVITCAIPVGDTEFVLGESRTVPARFVTWRCKDGTDYIWGHYMDNPFQALKDLCSRVIEEAEYLELREKEPADRNQPEDHNPETENTWTGTGGREGKPAGKQKREITQEER